MPDEPNPYEAPPTVLQPSEELQTESSKIDFPGGLRTAGVVGIVGGHIVAFVFVLMGSNQFARGDLGILTVVGVWIGAFAYVGWLLPGSSERRTARSALMGFLALPATILYVPVCGIVMITSMDAISEPGGLFLGSVVAFTAVLLLFAVFIRQRARANWVAEHPWTSATDPNTISVPTAAADHANEETQPDE